MFELYSENIDPGNQNFQEFIRNYVATIEPKDPQTIPYSQLYKVIKEGIREFMSQKKERLEK
jgi:hypothetical protein